MLSVPGTECSNPSPSSKESANFRSLSGGRKARRAPPVQDIAVLLEKIGDLRSADQCQALVAAILSASRAGSPPLTWDQAGLLLTPLIGTARRPQERQRHTAIRMVLRPYGENAKKLMRSAEGRTKRTQRHRKWPSGYVVSDVGPCSAAGNDAARIDTAAK